MSFLPRPRIVLLVAAVLAGAPCLLPMPTQAGEPLRFAAGFRWYDSERVAEDLVAADLDDDGILDLVLTQPDVGAVSVLLGAPGGGFQHRVGYDAGGDSHDVAAFDADGDGHVDVVVTSRTRGAILLLPGRGDGSLGPPRVLFDLPYPGPALARDFDGDGSVDLVMAADEDFGRLVFIRGKGDGTFLAPVEIHRGAGPLRVTSVDLPGLRHQGLAVADAAGAITVLASTPRGRFRVVDTAQLPGALTAICTTDVDGDGLADLVLATATSAPEDTVDAGLVVVLRGSASARFRPGAGIDAGFVPSCVAAVDVDGDGWDDILAPDRRGGGLGFLRNNRAGGFDPVSLRPSRLGSHRPALGDWNCDGKIDLVSLGPVGRGAVLLTGQGDGRFGDAVDLVTSFGPAGLWLGDVNDDGAPDLVATDVYAARLAVLRGDGAGGFAPQDHASTFATRSAPALVAGARLVVGGPVDLVIAHERHDGILSRGRNRGDGTFTFSPEDTVHTGGHPTAFLLADVDADGAPDAVVANLGKNTVTILRGDGAGWFRRHATLAVGEFPPVGLALGDLDGDDRLDLVVAIEAGRSVRVFRGVGGGDFVPGNRFRTGLRPLSVALADVDGDGHLDLVSGQGAEFPANGLVVIYRGDGTGRFAAYDPTWTASVGLEPTRVLVEDFDRDGLPDVAAANTGSSSITLLSGVTPLGFSGTGMQTLGTRAATGALVAGDLDRDGWTDLAIAGLVSDRIGLLRNRTGDAETRLPAPSIDIAPGVCPNPLPAEGVLRVALVSSGAFDFADLLPNSVRLEGVAPLDPEPAWADESGPVDACAAGCGCDGREPDGVIDAIFLFDADAVGAARAGGAAGAALPLRFTARLRGGSRLALSDCLDPGTGALPASAAAGAVDPPSLHGPNPLPFGRRVALAYTVPAGGAEVEIGVFDVAGRRVASLARGFEPAGEASVEWTPRDVAGRTLAPGVYFVRARVGTTISAARLVLVP